VWALPEDAPEKRPQGGFTQDEIDEAAWMGISFRRLTNDGVL
jgi:hypothetical protein